jgi:alkaline phosphatase
MKTTAATSRRDFLRSSVLTSAVFGAESALSAPVTREASVNQGTAKNVIFMVSDGMNHGALSLARQYQNRVLKKESHWMKMYRELPIVRGLMETFSANSCVTDSAAAASAWGAGVRVKNGVINITGDGRKLTPLHTKLQGVKKRTGLVSTATITHATPAGFAANVDTRASEKAIAEQYLQHKVDVLLGGGTKFFSPELRAQYQAAGYEVIDHRKSLQNLTVTQKPLLGLFSESHLPFSIDRNNLPAVAEKVPTLAEMTTAALNRLAPAREGFFLMVEGARIDHAGHANDAAASVHDQIAFDDAIGTALAFVEKNPDTLLIVTTDHGCGGIQMNGISAKKDQGFGPGLYVAADQAFEKLSGFTRSFEWMKKEKIDGLNGPKLTDAIRAYTNLTFSPEETKAAQGLKLNVADLFQNYTGVGWTSGNHTGELVEFCAYGPGSHLFPAFQENYQIHERLLRVLGIS